MTGVFRAWVVPALASVAVGSASAAFAAAVVLELAFVAVASVVAFPRAAVRP